MSMTVEIVTMEYLPGTPPEAAEFLTYVLEQEPEKAWIMKNGGASIIEIRMDLLKDFIIPWMIEKNRGNEPEGVVRNWLKRLEKNYGDKDPVMLHICV